MPSLYPHAKGILSALKDKGIDLAIASRSPTADIANTFIDKLSIKSMFVTKVSQNPFLTKFNSLVTAPVSSSIITGYVE